MKFQVVFRHPGRQLPGLTYWTEQEQSCCKVNSVQDFHSREPVPYHLAAYVRIYSLYETGGIFSDFSFLHTTTISSKIDTGVYIRPECLPDHFENTGRCIKASIYVFRGKHHPVLSCMLNQYDSMLSDLNICIKLDTR